MRNVRSLKKMLVCVLMIYLLMKSQKLTAQSKMKLTKEEDASKTELTTYGKENTDSNTSEEYERMLNEILELADYEIKRTAEESVKAISIELGGELAYEKTRADTYENMAKNLSVENECLKHELTKKRVKTFLYGFLTSSITILAVNGIIKMGANWQ